MPSQTVGLGLKVRESRLLNVHIYIFCAVVYLFIIIIIILLTVQLSRNHF